MTIMEDSEDPAAVLKSRTIRLLEYLEAVRALPRGPDTRHR